MSKILYAILTCNRYHYFKNCIESIFEFVDMDRVDLLVCDNCTVEPGFDEYAHQIASRKNIVIHKFEDRVRNELYRAMNWAIKYAQKNKYEIINFIQDDYQYLFKYDKHLDDMQKIFSKNNKIVQVNQNLVWRRKRKGHGKLEFFDVDGTNYAIFKDKRAVDNGFTRVDIYDKVGLYPGDAVSWGGSVETRFAKHPDRYKNKENGEVWFGRNCRRLGYERAVSMMPNMGMIYDCAFVRGNVRMGKYFKPKGKYYLKPFDEEQIEQIKQRNKKRRFVFIEDMCKPDGWEPQTFDKHSTADIVENIRNPAQ